MVVSGKGVINLLKFLSSVSTGGDSELHKMYIHELYTEKSSSSFPGNKDMP